MIKSIVATAGALALGAAFGADVFYSNDFTTRTSGPVQSGRWLERRYKVDTRFASNSNLDGNASAVVFRCVFWSGS